MHPVNHTAREVQKLKRQWSHNLRVSPASVHDMEAVFSTVREINGRGHDDLVDDFGRECCYLEHFWIPLFERQFILDKTMTRIYVTWRSHLWNSVGPFFNESSKLISEQKDITGESTVDFLDFTWMSPRLRFEKASRITNAKKSTSSPTLCSVWKNDEWPHCDLEESN